MNDERESSITLMANELERLRALNAELVGALEGLVTEWGGTLACHAGDPKAEAARTILARAKESAK